MGAGPRVGAVGGEVNWGELRVDMSVRFGLDVVASRPVVVLPGTFVDIAGVDTSVRSPVVASGSLVDVAIVVVTIGCIVAGGVISDGKIKTLKVTSLEQGLSAKSDTVSLIRYLPSGNGDDAVYSIPTSGSM